MDNDLLSLLHAIEKVVASDHRLRAKIGESAKDRDRAIGENGNRDRIEAAAETAPFFGINCKRINVPSVVMEKLDPM